MDADDAQPFITRTFMGHAAFVWRNLTPRSAFANLLALLWILLAIQFTRWFLSLRQRQEAMRQKQSKE